MSESRKSTTHPESESAGSAEQSLSFHKKLPYFALIDESGKTSATQVCGAEYICERGKKNQRGSRKHLLQNAARSKAVHCGHRKIQHNQVAHDLSGLGNGFFAI